MKNERVPSKLIGNKREKLSYWQAMEIVKLILSDNQSASEVSNTYNLWRTSVYNALKDFRNN